MTDVSKLASKIVNLDRSKGFVDNFDSLLDFALFMFMANPSQYERENFANHQQDEGYLEALQMIGDMSEGYHDALGDIFMDHISHGANGQFFTPEHICEMMAKITDTAGDRICDPCCGSGRMLLRGMQVSREEHDTDPYIYGCDLDHRAARMTLLNMCLNSARGDVEWGDTLLLDIFRTYHIDRVMVGGKWMSFVWQYDKKTDMQALNEERERTRRQLLECGIWYERLKEAPQVTKATEPSNLPAETKEAPTAPKIPPTPEPKPQEKMQPIPEPRRTPVQLSLFGDDF